MVLSIKSNNITHIHTMKHLGIIMIVLGALIMVFSYAADRFWGLGTVDNNWIQILAMVLVIAGIPTHIHVVGKATKA